MSTVFPTHMEFLTRISLQVSATDADKSSNNSAIHYSIDDFNNLFGESFLYINDFGNIFVNVTWTSPTFDYGNVSVFRVIALNTVDTNSTRLSATTTVSLVMTAVSAYIIVRSSFINVIVTL